MPVPEEEDVEMVENDGTFEVNGVRIPGPLKPRLTFDPDCPRLIISHIECINFKSYAGRNVMGPFHKNFTCIMGQNGSGKSNVIDSLLFVFGTSAKKIRSDKISSLIHYSEKHPNLASCKVTVFFQKIEEKGETYTVDKSFKMEISRTAYQNNSSVYEVNGKKSTFKHIKGLLKNEGIDLQYSRFLILQGEVEQISLMKPKAENENTPGMLEYLEDVIGTDCYVEPIKELREKVEELIKLRGEKIIALKFVEDQMDKLKEPWLTAVTFLKDTNDYVRYEHKKNQIKSMIIGEELEEASARKEKVDEESKDIQERFKEVAKQIQIRTEDLKECKKKSEEIERKCEKVKEGLLQLETEDFKLQNAIKNSQALCKKKEKQIEEHEGLIQKYKNLPEENAPKLVEFRRHKEKLEREKVTVDEEYAKSLSTLKGITDGLQKKKEAFESERLSLQANLNQAKERMSMAKSKLDIFKDSHGREKQKYEEMKAKYKSIYDKMAPLYKENEDLSKKIATGRKQLEKAKTEYETVREPAQNIERDFIRIQQQYTEMQYTYENSKSRNRLLNELSRQRDLGNIPGFIGRLGDLATIDDKYDVAISTACGLLDYYLVDNDETGKMCVRFARENKLGIVNCILLSKQQQFKERSQQRINVPAGSHRLFDLLRVGNPDHLPAFYFALRDCLVVNTIDEGDRISKKGFGPYRRCRVVTLDGTLFETTGAFSGGGVAQKGRMKSTLPVSADELEQMKKRYESINKERDHLVRKSTELQQTIGENEINLPKWEKALKLNQLEVKNVEGIVDKSQATLEKQREKVDATTCDPVEMKRLKTEFDEASSVYEREKVESDKLDEKITEINKNIQKTNDEKMKPAIAKRNANEKKLKKVTATIAELEAATATSERNCKKSEKAAENLRKSIEEEKVQLEENKKKMDEFVEEARVGLEKRKKYMEKIAELEETTKNEAKLLEESREAHNVLRAEKVDVDNKVKQQNAIVGECKAKLDAIDKAMKKLYLRDIPRSVRENMFQELEDVDNQETKILPIFSKEELKKIDKDALDADGMIIEDKIKNVQPNLKIIKEYEEQEKLYLQRIDDLAEVKNRVEHARVGLTSVTQRRLNEFANAMDIIQSKLTLIYQQLTMGGTATLEWVDSHDPFLRGISYSVRPPEKSWKSISNLSGGEKTLSSLSLVFALHFYRATPFYIMDEIDAALDCRNVSIIAEHIKAETRNAQFVIISLRPRMSARANYLLGVFKQKNMSSSAVLNVKEFLAEIKENSENKRENGIIE